MGKTRGRVAVITGASGGIGEAGALRLARDGWRIVLAARRDAELARVAAAVEGAGGAARTVVTDVTRRADVERLREEALATFGTIDVWINNAGRGITRSVLALTDEDVDEIVAVNVKSALYGMQAIVPWFVERGRGQVINVSSFLGRVPLAAHRSIYSAAKAMLNSLSSNLRMERAQRAPGVTISVLMPGVVTTDFARNVRGEGAPPPVAPTPAGAPRLAAQAPDEIGEAIAALIANPVAELYTNPAHGAVAQRYLADVAAFEAGIAGARPGA